MNPRDARRVPRVRGSQARRSAPPQDHRRSVIVVFEGERTERDYLGWIHERYGKRHGFSLVMPGKGTGGLTPSQVVDLARKMARETREDDVEVWALFDHDSHPDLPQAFAVARRAGIRVGFSHPAFDLWLLLHFQQFAAPQGGDNNRAIAELQRQPAFEDYARGKRVTQPRFDALEVGGGIARAVQNARKLDDSCPSGCCSGRDPADEGHPPSRCEPTNRDPSTSVWRLIEGLGITST